MYEIHWPIQMKMSIKYRKSLHGVLDIWTQCHMMEGTYQSTDLWKCQLNEPIQYRESIDCVLGIWTQGHRMEGTHTNPLTYGRPLSFFALRLFAS